MCYLSSKKSNSVASNFYFNLLRNGSIANFLERHVGMKQRGGEVFISYQEETELFDFI